MLKESQLKEEMNFVWVLWGSKFEKSRRSSFQTLLAARAIMREAWNSVKSAITESSFDGHEQGGSSSSSGKAKAKARGLVLAKVLYFSTAMGNVAWNRFQNLYFLDAGIQPHQIGNLKALGLALKLVGEPFWCLVADWTEPKIVFVICLLTQLFSMEILRNVVPLTVTVIVYVKFIRTATAPSTTLTTMASFKLTEGTKEGFGQQRMYGSLAWGVGAWVVGSLIDYFGMKSIFYYTYFFQCISLFIVAKALPSSGSAPLAPAGGGGGGGGGFAGGEKEHSSPYAGADDGIDVEGGGGTAHKAMFGSGSGSSSSAVALQQKLATAGTQVVTAFHLSHNKLKQAISDVKQFLAKKSCNFLLLNAFLTGVIMQVMETYLFVSFAESMHSTNGFGGLCSCVGSFSCAIFFYFSDRLIKKYGHGQCLLFSEVVFFVRLALLSVTSYHWRYSRQLLVGQHVLAGPSFAMFWATSVDALFKQSPRHLGSTCMATLNMFYFVLGPCVGSLLWGYVYEWFGGMSFGFYFLTMLMQGYCVYKCFLGQALLNAALDTKGADGEDEHDEKAGLLGKGRGSAVAPGEYHLKVPELGSHARKPHAQV